MKQLLLTVLVCVGVCAGMMTPSPNSPTGNTAVLAAVTANNPNSFGSITVVDSKQSTSQQTAQQIPGTQTPMVTAQQMTGSTGQMTGNTGQVTVSTGQMSGNTAQMPGSTRPMAWNMGQMSGQQMTWNPAANQQMAQVAQMNLQAQNQQVPQTYPQTYVNYMPQPLFNPPVNAGGPYDAYTASIAKSNTGHRGTAALNPTGSGAAKRKAFHTQAKDYLNRLSLTMSQIGKDGVEKAGRFYSMQDPVASSLRMYNFPSYSLLNRVKQSDPAAYRQAYSYLQRMATFDRLGNDRMMKLLAQQELMSGNPVTTLMAKIDIASGKMGVSDFAKQRTRMQLASEFGMSAIYGFI